LIVKFYFIEPLQIIHEYITAIKDGTGEKTGRNFYEAIVYGKAGKIRTLSKKKTTGLDAMNI